MRPGAVIWNEQEVAYLMANYHLIGAAGCAAALTGRCRKRVQSKAMALGLRFGKRNDERERIWPRGTCLRDSVAQSKCDLALNNWPALAPANDLFWRIGA